MTALRYVLFFCGQLGVMALARFFFQWLLRFAGGDASAGVAPLLAASAVGAVFLGFRIFDGATDPVAGFISDGWVRRGRERRTLLWWAFWLPAVGLVMIFTPTLAMGVGLRWLLIAGGMLLFFVGYTLYVIPYWSLIDDYSQGDGPVRSRLSNLLGAGTLVATALGFVVSPMLVDALGFFWASICFGVPAALLMILPYWAAPGVARAKVETAASAAVNFAAFLRAFRHRRFVAVIALFAGSQMSFSVMTAAAPFIAVDLLGGTNADVAKLLGPFLLTAIPCFVFVPKLAARVGWERSVVLASLGLGAVYAGTAALGGGMLGTPLLTAMVLFGCAGPMASVLLGLEGEAVAGCADECDGQVTSIYFGVFNLVVKALNGVAIALTGALAEAVAVHGKLAVRAMGFSAGVLLVLGVVGYWLLRPPTERDAA